MASSPHKSRPQDKTGDFLDDPVELARRIWLAGLGALSYGSAGRELFNRLVSDGSRWQERGERQGWTSVSGVAEPSLEWEGRPEAIHPVLRALGNQKWPQSVSRNEPLIEALVPPSFVPDGTAVLQARRNAAAREDLLRDFGALSSAEVAELVGSKAANKAALANRWKQEGRIFSVTFQGGVLFPAFQFDAEGQPRPVIADVIAALKPTSSDWELALWLAAPTGWLAGRRPVDLLDEDPSAVAEAARREAAELVF